MKRKPKNEDVAQAAFRIVNQATSESAPSRSELKKVMSYMGRMGGLKGGKARAESLSAERRSEIAQKAAKTRWKYK